MHVVESRALHWLANEKNSSKADLLDCWRSNFFLPQRLRGCQVTQPGASFLSLPFLLSSLHSGTACVGHLL